MFSKRLSVHKRNYTLFRNSCGNSYKVHRCPLKGESESYFSWRDATISLKLISFSNRDILSNKTKLIKYMNWLPYSLWWRSSLTRYASSMEIHSPILSGQGLPEEFWRFETSSLLIGAWYVAKTKTITFLRRKVWEFVIKCDLEPWRIPEKK